jgi:hypothetical protein
VDAKEFIDSLFEGYEQTPALADLKEELLGNLNAKIESLVKNGMEIEAAAAKAFDELGDVSELAESLIRKTGTGKTESREKAGGNFTGISLECGGDLFVHPGNAHRIVVTADSDIQELVKTEVAGTTLRISTKSAPVFRTIPWLFVRSSRVSNLKIDVYMPELRKINIGGSGNATVGAGSSPSLEVRIDGSGCLNAESYQTQEADVSISGSGSAGVHAAESLAIKIAGSGSVNAESCETKDVSVEIAGSGDVNTCATQSLAVKIFGSGSVNAENCETKDVRVEIADSGDVRTWAAETLNVRTAGSGDVYYKGNANVQASNAGNGRIIKLAGGEK